MENETPSGVAGDGNGVGVGAIGAQVDEAVLNHPVQQGPIGVSFSEADCDEVDVWIVADELAIFLAESSSSSRPAGQIITRTPLRSEPCY